MAPVADDFSWTGFYVGLRLGYGWHDGSISSELLPNDLFFIEPGTLENDADGITGGGQLGFNWQLGRFVLGAEADFSGAAVDDESNRAIAIEPGPFPGNEPLRHEIDWFGTVRGRLGFAPTQRLLVYGTGGFAYAHIEQTAGIIVPVTDYVNRVEQTEVGWTLGGGIEYALGRNWSVKAEYLYLDFGKSSMTALAADPNFAPFRVNYDWDNDLHSFSIGVNYLF